LNVLSQEVYFLAPCMTVNMKRGHHFPAAVRSHVETEFPLLALFRGGYSERTTKGS